jgi:hypothetical protein
VPGLTELANGVLTKLGDATVSSLDDGSTAAQLIKANIDRLRRAEIRKYRWNFAGEAASLPEVLPAPPFRWAHAYALPVPAGGERREAAGRDRGRAAGAERPRLVGPLQVWRFWL